MSSNHIGLLPTAFKGNAEDTSMLLDRFSNSRRARDLEEEVRKREETKETLTGLTGGISTAVKIAFTTETDYSKGSLGGKIKDLIFNRKGTVLDIVNSIVATVPGIDRSLYDTISETIISILRGILPFIHLVVRYTFPAYAPLTGALNALLKSTVDTPVASVLEMEVDKEKKSDSSEKKEHKHKHKSKSKPKPKEEESKSKNSTKQNNKLLKKEALNKIKKDKQKAKMDKKAKGVFERRALKEKIGGSINGVPNSVDKLISLFISLVSFIAKRYKK